MKKFFMIAVMAVAALTASAQSNSCQGVGTVSFKPYAGISMGMFLGKKENTEMRTGFTAGAEAQYMINDWFALSAGAAYSQQGGMDKEDGVDWKYNFDYINIPVLANFYVCKGLALKVGVQPGFAVSQKLSLSKGGNSATGDISEYFNKFDIALPIGLSYEIKNIVIDTRVNAGAIGVFDDDEDDNYTNGVFQLTLGYRF